MCSLETLRAEECYLLKPIRMEQTKKLMMDLIKERAVVKQDVFDKCKETFNTLKEVLAGSIEEIESDFGDSDGRVEFNYSEHGEHEAEIKIAGDVLKFYMHTNVFQFDRSNSLWKSSYLQENELNGYVGVINIYNFLADSFKYQRMHDRGYLIGRIFVNREGHFMVQGKRQLGYLFNDFLNMQVTREQLQSLAYASIIYTIGFDLYTPPYQNVQEVSVGEATAMSHYLNVATGKRLGFKFSHEEEIVD